MCIEMEVVMAHAYHGYYMPVTVLLSFTLTYILFSTLQGRNYCHAFFYRDGN